MESVLIAALFAAASPSEPAAPSGVDPTLDRRCFQVMAELAESDDPRIRSTARVAAQYFLGRIDAASPGADVGSFAAPQPGERDALLGRCSAAMQAGGRDFRAIGEELAPRSRPAA